MTEAKPLLGVNDAGTSSEADYFIERPKTPLEVSFPLFHAMNSFYHFFCNFSIFFSPRNSLRVLVVLVTEHNEQGPSVPRFLASKSLLGLVLSFSRLLHNQLASEACCWL